MLVVLTDRFPYTESRQLHGRYAVDPSPRFDGKAHDSTAWSIEESASLGAFPPFFSSARKQFVSFGWKWNIGISLMPPSASGKWSNLESRRYAESLYGWLRPRRPSLTVVVSRRAATALGFKQHQGDVVTTDGWGAFLLHPGLGKLNRYWNDPRSGYTWSRIAQAYTEEHYLPGGISP